jgi:chromosome segregation ATPase
MGNILQKCSKIKNYNLVENNENRHNLLYDSIHQDIEDNRNSILNLKSLLTTMEKNNSLLFTQLNTEMVTLKNELEKNITTNGDCNRQISKINNINEKLVEEFDSIRTRIVTLESNDQFHSICN